MTQQEGFSNPFTLLATQATKINFDTKDVPFFTPMAGFNFYFNHKIAKSTTKDLPTQDREKVFIVEFDVHVHNTQRTFNVHVVFQVWFNCQNPVTEEFLNTPQLRISALAISFPFVRSLITTMTASAGYSPLYLPSVNFVKLVNDELAAKTTKV